MNSLNYSFVMGLKNYAKLLFVVFLIYSCGNKRTLFKKISSKHSGIHFNNLIQETDSINILDFSNVYNGGGVGIGDFNNDGLEDIYFSGNLVENKLYLNQGNLKFKDVTTQADVAGKHRWGRGVAVVDINNDGLADIYVSASIKTKPSERENLLYVNTGVDKGGIPHFKEMGKEYGLNDTTHTTQAAFFDYDNDGDLDVYLCVNEIIPKLYPNQFRPVIKDGSFPSTGQLYRNDWDSLAGHPVFKNVSKQAGITIEGYGHNVAITDINHDGWKDIYVTNDYLSSNILYLNNRDGTFTDKIGDYLKHASANAMGSDISDINNDGLQDIIELDMNPEDNYRKKMMMMPVSYQTYQNTDLFGYHYQYVRNTLQLNLGDRMLKKDSAGEPIFGDIGFYSGIAETDWSWAPLVADFNNDSYRDIIVTNGFPKDVTDHDFIAFRNTAFYIATKQQLLEQIPEVKLHNYAFRNDGNLKFTDESFNWGLGDPTFSNGAAFADFDNDGDLDFVVNNINDEALLYENTEGKNAALNNHLDVKFEGTTPNRDGFGAWVNIYYGDQQQVYEHYAVRGYLSSVSPIAHFGLGNHTKIDSLIVTWPDGRLQKIYNINANQTITLSQNNANGHYDWNKAGRSNALFSDITDSCGVKFTQREIDYIDFNVQKLLPHKLSQYGPAIAVGDINGDGLDDFVVGGSYGYSTKFFLQDAKGRFDSTDLQPDANRISKTSEDLGILLFDADNDSDLDLYIASGGYENEAYSSHYADKFYMNDGKGHFTLDTSALPVNYTSKSCVKAFDYDKDGDLDLFVGGRVEPWRYPKAVSSFIYRNDSQNGRVKFTNVSDQVCPVLKDVGLICDASCTDFDNDGWPDLILAGEWMPLKFLKNEKGHFKDVTDATGISNKKGWWNSIASGDFDNDGDMDYVVGNLGENSFLRASDQYPVSIYAKDFNKNGVYQCIPTTYLKDRDGKLKEFPVDVRDDVVDQLPFIKKRFLTYKEFSVATIDKLFTKDEIKDAIKLSANCFESAFIRNNGNGTFKLEELPAIAQLSCINAITAEDFDADGNLDVCVSTNDYGTIPAVGRYDALNGLILKGDGRGGFKPLSISQSGICIDNNGKSLAKLRRADGSLLLLAGQNRGPLKIYKSQQSLKTVSVTPDDQYAIIAFTNGKKQKIEFSYGSSFLSQNSRFFVISKNITSCTITNSSGKERKVL